MSGARKRRTGIGPYILLALLVVPAVNLIVHYRHASRPVETPPKFPFMMANLDLLAGPAVQGPFTFTSATENPESAFDSIMFQLNEAGESDPRLSPIVDACSAVTPTQSRIINNILGAEIQCRSARGDLLGRSNTVALSVVGGTAQNTLWCEFPKTYPPQTASLVFNITDKDHPELRASWTVKCPPSFLLVPESEPLVDTVRFGDNLLEAAAAEIPDSPPPVFDPMHPIISNEPVVPHEYSGFPGIQCVVRMPRREVKEGAWEFHVTRIDPEWKAPEKDISPPMVTPFFPSRGKRAPDSTPDHWLIYCGAAYPGQQKRVRVYADVVRIASKMETVTFHDADLIEDPVSHCYSLDWTSPQTGLTSFGRAVAVLNPHRVTMVHMPPQGTTLYVFLASRTPDANDGSVAFADTPMTITGVSDDGVRYTTAGLWGGMGEDWSRMSMPGTPVPAGKAPPGYYQRAMKPLMDAKYRASQLQGSLVVAPKSTSTHLKTVTVTYMDRVTYERHPVVFTLPVKQGFDSSWIPATSTMH